MAEMSLGDIVQIVKEKWRMLLIVTLVCGGLSFILSQFIIPPKYASQARLLINIPTENGTQQLNNAQLQANTRLIATYSDIIKDDSVIEVAKEKAGIEATNDAIRSMVRVSSNRDSQVFTVTVTSGNPDEAAKLANGLTEAFKQKVSRIYTDTETFVVLSPAEANQKRVSPNRRNNTVLGLVAGFVVTLLCLIGKGLLTTAVQNESVIEELGWANLGEVSLLTEEEIKITRLRAMEEFHVN